MKQHVIVRPPFAQHCYWWAGAMLGRRSAHVFVWQVGDTRGEAIRNLQRVLTRPLTIAQPACVR